MAQIKSSEISDAFWARVEPLIPSSQRPAGREYRRQPGGGRKPMPPRQIFSAIVYVLRSGCQWKALPREFGSASAVHKHFQQWQQAVSFLPCGVPGWLNMTRWKALAGIGRVSTEPWARLRWPSNVWAPTPRIGAKKRRKRSLLVDEHGVPLSLVVSGANVHDVKLLSATLERVVIALPESSQERSQNLCADAGYKGKPARNAVVAHNYQPHIKQRREEDDAKRTEPGYKVRSWVVE